MTMLAFPSMMVTFSGSIHQGEIFAKIKIENVSKKRYKIAMKNRQMFSVISFNFQNVIRKPSPKEV